MAHKTINAPIPTEGHVTVPRVALQALAEWAYPVFASDRIWAKLPAKHPRLTSWNTHDDLHQELEQERMSFLKSIMWKASNEAIYRERALDPARGYGGNPSLELFMECLAEMEDPLWDEPLPLNSVADRKREIKAKNTELGRLVDELEHPTPETILKFITMTGDIALFNIKKNLADENPEVQAKAQEEIRRLMAELDKLVASSLVVA